MNTKVTAIKETGNGILLEATGDKTMDADKIIICVPPIMAS
ncbi:MAG: hypothetical protein J0H29_14910 [Sphingobacteriales bacterium]|nr:hypothetical protein [Sphingobacteriales bacterium]